MKVKVKTVKQESFDVEIEAAMRTRRCGKQSGLKHLSRILLYGFTGGSASISPVLSS
jgi:hypothetical protein